MAFIQSDTYVVPHDKGKGGSGRATYVYNNGGGSNYNSMNASSINASQAVLDYITAKGITANDANITYLMTKEGQIIKLSGNELYYKSGYIGDLTTDSLNVSKIKADEIEALKGYIDTLNSKNITTEYLTVTKQAHFFELIIDKIRSVGGTIILTATDSILDKVYAYDSSNNLLGIDDFSTLSNSTLSTIHHFDVYWRADLDGESSVAARRKLENSWVVGDQALCQSFNNVSTGKNYDVANKYYWRYVRGILDDKYINLVTGEMRDIEDGNGDPVNLPTSLEFRIGIGSVYTQLNSESEYEASKIRWTVTPQSQDVTWISVTNGTYDTYGKFITATRDLGIQLTPNPYSTDNYEFITKKIDLYIAQYSDALHKADNINVGIYYKDGSFSFFPDVQTSNSYTVTLELPNANAPIESIVIVSTNEIQWHLCHGIVLSNYNSTQVDNYDNIMPVSDSNKTVFLASCPGPGDNIVQLGYRSNGADDPNNSRQNAIIISAYNTPDKGGMYNGNLIRAVVPPSYAQYEGINDFNLYLHRKTFMDGKGSTFHGDFILTGGTNIIDKIDEKVNADYWKNSKILTDKSNISIVYDRETTVSTITPSSLSFSILYYSAPNTASNVTIIPEGYRVVFKAYTKNGEYTGETLHYTNPSSLSSFTTSTFLNQLIDYGGITVNDLRTLNVTLYKGSAIDSNYIDSINVPIIYTENAKDGDDGDDGETTEVIKLSPNKEILIAELITSAGNQTPCYLHCELDYSIIKVEGDTISSLNWNNYKMKLTAYNRRFNTDLTNGYLWSTTVTTGTYVAKDDPNDGAEANNLLKYINPESSYSSNYYRDYMTCSSKECIGGTNPPDLSSRCPYYLKVQLIDNADTKVYDERIVYVEIEHNTAWIKTEDFIKSIAGDGTITENWLNKHYTKFEQTANGFNILVNNTMIAQAEWDQDASEYKITNINIDDSVIESVVSREYATKEYVQGEIQEQLGDYNSFRTIVNLYDTSTGTQDTETIGNFAGDNDTYYPVFIDAHNTNVTENGPLLTCQVDCALDEFSYQNYNRPSWGGIYNAPPNNNRGVALLCNFSAMTNNKGEWNGNVNNVYINSYELKWTRKATGTYNPSTHSDGKVYDEWYDPDNTRNNIIVLGTIRQGYGKIGFYLRGGAKYNIRYTWPNINVSVMKSGDPSVSLGGHTYQIRSGAENSNVVVPELDRLWKSQIKQTAEEISLSVWKGTSQEDLKRTGIDITNGKIELTADNTDINGNLNIYNANEGLSVYDSNNNPKISILNRSLGNNPQEISNESYIVERLDDELSAGTSSINFTNTINLGTFKNGTTVTLSNFNITIGLFEEDSNGGFAGTTASISSLSISYSGVKTGSQSSTGAMSGLNNYSFTGDGNNKVLNLSITGTLTNYNSSHKYLIRAKINGKVSYTSTQGVLIGTDGIAYQSNNAVAWFANGQNIIQSNNDDNSKVGIIKVTDGKIQRNGPRNPSKYGDISSIIPVTNVHNGTYNATNDDAFILCSSSGVGGSNIASIYLPGGDNAIIGKVFYVKNLEPAYTCTVYVENNGDIYAPVDDEPLKDVNVECHSFMFVCVGRSEYVAFYCG